jgi:tetratricopeptide (TPR) repeat protein
MWFQMIPTTPALAQNGPHWSAERNVLPEGFGASEAKVVILSDGSINVTFRGGSEGDPQLGAIYFTRSTDQGYSWSTPKSAVELSGIQSVTHELMSDGDSLLIYVGVNRVSRYEIQQYISVNRGQTWQSSETVYSNPDPIRAMLSWQMDGRMFMFVLSERTRAGADSEYTFWLANGRASGAYWEPAVKVASYFANRSSPPRLIKGTRWPSVLWTQNGVDNMLLETSNGDGVNWRPRPVATPPVYSAPNLIDRGIAYRVQTTANRQLLFNRTDDEPPTTDILSDIPREVETPSLTVTWQGKDNYTLPKELRYMLQVDENEPTRIKDATSYELTNLINGAHLVTILAIDEAGNRQTPATTKRFMVKVPPVPRFQAPQNGDLFNQGTVSSSWEASQNCVAGATVAFSLKVDEAEWLEFTTELSHQVQGLTDGEHALFLKAKDSMGNISPSPATVRFEVDITPPTCLAEELPRDWEKIGSELDFEQDPEYKVQFKITGKDNRTPPETLEYRYRLDQEAPNTWLRSDELTVLSGLTDGAHQVAFETRDEAQNIQTQPTIVQFEYNTPPNTRVWIDESGPTPLYRFASKDRNSSAKDQRFRWKIDEQSWTEWMETTTLSVQELIDQTGHGQHTLFVQSRDPAGNIDPTPALIPVDVDKQAPPPPRNLQIISREDGGEIQYSWDAVSEPNVFYRVYRSNSMTYSKEAVPIQMELDKPKGFDRPKRHKESATYYYFVSSIDRSGNESTPVVSEPQVVLGEKELNEKRFSEYKSNVEGRIRAEEYDRVIDLANTIPSDLVELDSRAPYPSFWRASAQAMKALSVEANNPEALAKARTDLDKFLNQYMDAPLTSEAKPLLDRVKARILWLQVKQYGTYGGIVLVVLVILFLFYRAKQRRSIQEMPHIQAESPTEGITPSKEALKDPTVLRRWAEVQSEPTSAENWSRLAFAFHNIGEIENAIQSLYKALEIEPNNTRFHFQMGHFLKESGKTRDAIRHFERYLQLNPESKKSVEEVKELLTKLKGE